jgi:hypothetical protein
MASNPSAGCEQHRLIREVRHDLIEIAVAEGLQVVTENVARACHTVSLLANWWVGD